MTRAVLLTLTLAALTSAGTLSANAPAATDDLALAQAAEQRLEPAQALELYRRYLAAHDGRRLARRAEARIAWLEARDEGGFGPLTELERLRRVDHASLPQDALREFAAKVARFPTGRVRRESYHLLADRWLARGEAAEALAAYAAWLGEPGLDEGERQLAASGAALARARLGHADALSKLDDAGLGTRAEGRYLRAERVGRALSLVSWTALAAFAFLAAMSGWRHRRALRFRAAVGRGEVALAAFALGVPVALVRRYDEHLVSQFSPSMLASAGALGLAWFAASVLSPPPKERRRLALASAAAIVAASVLACRHSGMLTDVLMAAWEPH
ncbi:MAG: hypothetical protein FJ095_17740 [Deltaproteobacteria bacterium]|nr:hypothetical protein [Deltaproteobacteria bacterium]